MIKELHLKSWKSFRDATLFLDELSILIGTNASGKSNALDAIDFFSRVAQSKDLAASLQFDGKGNAFRGGAEWVVKKGEKSFTLTLIVGSDDKDTDYRYTLTVTPAPHPIVVEESLTRIKRRPRSTQTYDLKLFWTESCRADAPAITARLYNEKSGSPREMMRGIPVLTQLNIGSSGLTRMQISHGVKAVWDAISRLFILNPIPSHMRPPCAKAEKMAQDGSNLAGVIAALPDRIKKQVEARILKYVRDLPEKDIRSLKAELFGPFSDLALLVCEEGWGSDHESLMVDSRAMSDGTLRFIAIITALLTLPERTQLVIEEVDNGLHPSRSYLLLRMLREIGRERNIDVLATTHNPALLDALGPAMVPFVTVAHRDPTSGDSKLILLEDIGSLPKIMSAGRLGTVTANGTLERVLNPNATVQAELPGLFHDQVENAIY